MISEKKKKKKNYSFLSERDKIGCPKKSPLFRLAREESNFMDNPRHDVSRGAGNHTR